MKDRIILKLTSARFLIALILTIVFAVLAVIGKLNKDFITIYTVVIAFYYSKEREDKE